MRWITRGLLAAALAFGVVVPTTAPGANAATELLTNGNFSSGTTGWWGSDNTPISNDAGQLKAIVPGGTANKWDTMLGQKVPAFPIKKSHRYVLSFDARASADRAVRTTVQLNQPPYTPNIDRTFTVSTTSQRFAFAFTATQEIANSELTFQMGGVAGYTLWLDNVSLVDNYGNVAGNPVSLTSGFYVDPKSNPKDWVDKNPGDDANKINAAIASKPMARWFGNWNSNIADAVYKFVGPADTADKLPVLVAYNIPGRDACGEHSGGGAGSKDAYKAWIETFAAAIGTRPAVVIVEPDSIADRECMTETEWADRKEMLTFALQQFKELAPNTWTYLDAANTGWGRSIGEQKLAGWLSEVGVANAHGFSVNVSNYYYTSESITYANALNSYLPASKPFVVDTSRNGAGSLNGEWCNPSGRKLGATAQTGGGAEMLLWVKVPGDSDGDCGISDRPAGQFGPELALALIP
ncbi:endoglucanase [Kribbella antiqua]|uniref:Glucanase n=1 Tax=Kribbella antiqua TaxID=2512217 RepID=A0A4R2IJ64_9ACTN|nr:glycoside hydrolase family 6 protein [Kribbella antiqua]TCO44953.1 endoglucanase [Kribbella antiqua]